MRCLLFLLFLLPIQLYAAPTLLLNNDQYAIDLKFYADILPDPSGVLTLKEVTSAKQPFHALSSSNTLQEWQAVDKGFTQSAFWLRVKMSNQSNQPYWYFGHWGGLSRHVQAYLGTQDQSSWQQLTLLPHARSMQYGFPLAHGESGWLYFRVQDKHAPLTISPELLKAPSLLGRAMADYPFFSVMIGGLLTLALFNALYFFYLQDTRFLALAVFIVSFVLEMGNHLGVLHYFAFSSHYLQNIGSLFGFTMLASVLSLFMHWLDSKNNLPQWHQWLIVAMGVSIALAIASPLFPYHVAVIAFWAVIIFILCSVAVWSFYRQGLRLPLSMIMAVVVFFITASPALLRATGVINEVYWLVDLALVGLLTSLVLLSLSQAEQIKQKSLYVDRIAAANTAKDEFLATMSHELRTPMNAVVGAGHLLKLTSLSAIQQDYVSRLNMSSQHMLALINDILDLAQSDSRFLRLEQTSFRLDDMLRTIEQLTQQQAHEKQLTIQLNNHFLSLNNNLRGDPLRLKQVLLNLLTNAGESSPLKRDAL